MSGSTPSQTVGPFLHIVLPWPDGPYVVAEGTPGAVRITGRVTDGAGAPVPDALIEVWQADPSGAFVANGTFRGFGRCPTDGDGEFWFCSVRPASLPGGAGTVEAPHLDVSVFARGLLHRLVTRIYFPDEPENAADPVLASLDADDRALLTATAQPDGSLRFDISLQGARETPFFTV